MTQVGQYGADAAVQLGDLGEAELGEGGVDVFLVFFGALLGLLALALPRERAFAAGAREAETAGNRAEALCEPCR
ncbi:hypothetical protein ABZ769_10420 [Streptomyces olivoreticuli]